jgi:hypothetical protein
LEKNDLRLKMGMVLYEEEMGGRNNFEELNL